MTQPAHRRLVTEAHGDDRYAFRGEIADNAVVSDQVGRFVVSSNPDEVLNPRDFLVVYEPPFTLFNPLTSLDGLTRRWGTSGTWSAVDDATALDGRAMQLGGAVTQRRAVTLDAVDAEPDRGDIDIVARLKVSATQTALSAGLVVRGSGAAGAESGYIAGVYSQSVHLAALTDGQFTHLAQSSFPYTPDGWFWLRLRAVGSQLQVRAWPDAAQEPSVWQLEQTSQAHQGPGWAGAFASASMTHTWDLIGVGLDESTAPKAAL